MCSLESLNLAQQSILFMRLIQASPLLFISSFFIIGLLLGMISNYWALAGALTIVAVSFLLILFKVGRFHFHLFFVALFVLLGTFRMNEIFPSFSEVLPVKQEHYFIVQIDEQLRQGDVWATNLVHVGKVFKDEQWIKVDQDVVMICETSTRLVKKGDKLLVKTSLNKIENKGNPGEFDAEYYWLSKGVKYQCFGFAENMKLLDTQELGFWDKILKNVREYSAAIIDRFVGNEQGDLVKAILLGDKSTLDVETKSSFANTGAMHVLAVSGLHVGIIAYLLNGLFQFLFSKINRKKAVILLILILWFYAFVTGFSASVTRAVFMYSVLIGAQLLERNYNSLNTLSFTALVLLCWNPLYLFDIGFQLSFLAMVGIFTVYPMLRRQFYIRNKPLNWLWQGTAVGLAAQVFTVPISLYYFHQFPNYFILSNIGVMLLAGLILGIGIALLLLGKIPWINVAVGWLLFVAVGILLLLISWIDTLPGAIALGFNPSVFWVLTCYFVIVFALVFQHKMNAMRSILLVLPLLLWIQVERFENINRAELCVFNSRFTTVLMNSRKQQVCVYAGNERGLKDAKRLVADYQKLHPGTIRFESLNGKEIQVQQSTIDLKISHYRYFVDVKFNKKHSVIITSSKFWKDRDIEFEAKFLAMPYLENGIGVDCFLKNGAWVEKF